jgi:hypothetical protein
VLLSCCSCLLALRVAFRGLQSVSWPVCLFLQHAASAGSDASIAGFADSDGALLVFSFHPALIRVSFGQRGGYRCALLAFLRGELPPTFRALWFAAKRQVAAADGEEDEAPPPPPGEGDSSGERKGEDRAKPESS